MSALVLISESLCAQASNASVHCRTDAATADWAIHEKQILKLATPMVGVASMYDTVPTASVVATSLRIARA